MKRDRSHPEPTCSDPGLPRPYSGGADSLRQVEALLRRGGERERIGTTAEGRTIEAYRWNVGPERTSAPGPGLLLLSLIHPMEWIGREVHLRLLGDLLSGAGDLPAGTRIYSLPDANPDGTARVEAALRAGRPLWVRGNSRGVDLNRNFPVDFRTRSRWIDFWPMWRPGPGPASEPETRSILDWIDGESISLSLSFHSFGRWFFHPPSARRGETAAGARHARCLDEVLRGTRPRGYRGRQLGRYAVWFRANGIEIDTLATRTGGLSYLVELSWGGFGRWGIRRLAHPFHAFNPPDPDAEYARVGPALQRLVEVGLSGPGGSETTASDGQR